MAIFKKVTKTYHYRGGSVVYVAADGTATAFDRRTDQLATFQKAKNAFDFMRTGTIPLEETNPVQVVAPIKKHPDPVQTSAIPSEKSGVGAMATGDLIPLM